MQDCFEQIEFGEGNSGICINVFNVQKVGVVIVFMEGQRRELGGGDVWVGVGGLGLECYCFEYWGVEFNVMGLEEVLCK